MSYYRNSWQPEGGPPYPASQPQGPPYPGGSPTYPPYPGPPQAQPPYPTFNNGHQSPYPPGYGPFPPAAPPPQQGPPYGYTIPPVQHQQNGYYGYHTPPTQGYNTPPPSAPPSATNQGYGYPPPSPQPPPSNPRLPPLPPTTAQNFGHGAPSDYQFRYSNCTGRRKALLIGINYIGQRNQLKGCINDVHHMSTFLSERYGYRREDMVILTDDQKNPMSQPTKQNILKAMQWLVKDAMPNDSLFLHFSGHGGQTADLDGDEDDGYDEVIYPVDYKSAGHIVDDEMHLILVKPLQPGVRLTAIFDSCHSGTALDLPFIYSTQGALKEPNLAKEFGLGLLSTFSAYERGDVRGAATAALSFLKKATIGSSARDLSMRTKTSPADVIMWSGSKDSQTSQDAIEDGQATGAMSWAFIRALTKQHQQSYLQLLNSIRRELEKKYTQKPQLSCSHPLDINLLFVM